MSEQTKKLNKIEEITTEEVKDKKVVNKRKKKIVILAIIITILILLIITFSIILVVKNSKQDEELGDTKQSNYIKVINDSLKSGELSKEVKKALNQNDIVTDSVYLMNLDINSDNKQDLVAYAEDDDSKFYINFTVDDKVTYENSYQVSSSDSLGYTYSIIDEKAYWYTEFNNSYSIISDTVKIITKEEYENNYYNITKEYNDEPISNVAIMYNLDKELDIEELEEEKITNKDLLKDNNTTLEEIKEKAHNYQKEKQEQEEKEKKDKEEEAKKKATEAKQKEEASTFRLEGKTLHYGKYIDINKILYEYIIINKDGSAIVDGKGCVWSKGKHDFAQDASTAGNPNESVNIICSDGPTFLTAYNNDELGDGDLANLKYEG